jgi:hypothetical protein
MRLSRAFLLPGALLALLVFGVGVAQARTTGFDISNLTAESVKITEVATTAAPQGAPVFEEGSKQPQRGQVLKTGETFHVELENPIGYTRLARLEFESPNGSRYTMELENGEPAKCHISNGRNQCNAGRGRVEMVEPPGSEKVVPKAELQEQARILKALCDAAHKCKFEVTSPEEVKTMSQGRFFGNAVSNCGPFGSKDVTTTLAAKQTLTISTSVGVELSTETEIAGAFKIGIKAHYDKTREESHEFSQDVGVSVEPHYIAYVLMSQPVIRDTGNFTLQLGNTKWVLKEVYFDSPDPSPERHGSYDPQFKKLQGKELQEHCPLAEEEFLTPLKPALASLTTAGTGSADLLTGGPENNTLEGLGGDDIIRGGAGDDELFGGPGADLIKGGPGADYINGGPGPDRIEDNSGPTTVVTGGNTGPEMDRVDVADGEGNDTVVCTTENTVVFADPMDQVKGNCGRVVRTSN